MNIELDRFAHIDSPLRRWDARWKLAAAALFVAATVCVRSLGVALLALCIAVVLVLIGRLPLSDVARRLKVPAVVIAVITLILVVTAPGERLSWAGLSLSRPGLLAGGLVAAKSFGIILALVSLVSSSTTQRLWAAMRRLHVPAGLVQVFHLAYRYVFVIQSESRAVHNAMITRGFRANLRGRNLSILGNAVGMLLIRSTERAERVYLAMQARGFDGTFPVVEAWSSRTSDILKFATLAASSAALLVLDQASSG